LCSPLGISSSLIAIVASLSTARAPVRWQRGCSAGLGRYALDAEP
jgi:hypothetical protein